MLYEMLEFLRCAGFASTWGNVTKIELEEGKGTYFKTTDEDVAQCLYVWNELQESTYIIAAYPEGEYGLFLRRYVNRSRETSLVFKGGIDQTKMVVSLEVP